MYYMYRTNWMCQFLEEDLKTPLPRRFYFQSPQKIRAIVEKVGNFADLQDRQALDYGLEMGRGGVWLQLTEEQYRRLKVPLTGTVEVDWMRDRLGLPEFAHQSPDNRFRWPVRINPALWSASRCRGSSRMARPVRHPNAR